MKVRMVDWSRWQGVLTADLLPPIGIDGVWLKACGAAKTASAPVDPFHVDPYFTQNAGLLRTWNNEHADSTLIRGAFCYLVHGYAEAQAALLVSLLRSIGGPAGWAIKLDVEDPSLTEDDVMAWNLTWNSLTRNSLTTPSYPYLIYTQRSKWEGQFRFGSLTRYTRVLEEAHWVDSAHRRLDLPRAEQERGIYPDWWDVEYADIKKAFGLQYTDMLQIGTARTTCTLYWCNREEFTNLLVR